MATCIDKFLVNYKQEYVEKHSDSSDFDETLTDSLILTKAGKHSLHDKDFKLKRKVNRAKNRSVNNIVHMRPNLVIDDNIPERDQNVANHKHRFTHNEECNNSRNRGDDLEDKILNRYKNTQNKPISSFSNILRQSNNCAKQNFSIKDIPENDLNNGKAFCPSCERRRIKKLNRRRQSYVVQPVYAVDNIQGGPVPFGHANDRAPLSQHNHKAVREQNSNTSYELTSSESVIGDKNQRKRRRNFIDRFQKEMRKEYMKYEKELIRNRIQQYPSQRDYNMPYQAFSSPYCQVLNAGVVGQNEQSKIPSTSSGFWDYLFDKIRGKRTEKNGASKLCDCPEGGTFHPLQQMNRCCPDNCAYYREKPIENNLNKSNDIIPDCKSCMQQTEDIEQEILTTTPLKKNNRQSEKSDSQSGRDDTQNVTCKCYSTEKRKQTNTNIKKISQKSLTQSDDVTKPCQKPHDEIIRTVEEKYNGEILCIHNPPCILINGCLNLPPSDSPPVQGNFWPITQGKKSSFHHICRKMKWPKNNCEQACQYHPPSIEVQRAMQIKAEKLVQSICNHDPPCEVVYGCYKAKYDPKLNNSCVHVPMCQRLPECLIEERHDSNRSKANKDKLCEHKPKCTELPLCSRKIIVLTAKGTVGTQVRPKIKLVCRHEPPCIMIPKCVAQIVSDGCIPFEAIPDCVHQPCCEMIPACCRRAAKEMVSVSSQYPKAPCRIV